MPRDYSASEDDMFANNMPSSSKGAVIRKLFQEIQEAIVQLQAMRDYARDNGKANTEQNLNKVIKSFEALKKKYGSAGVLNEIKKIAFMIKPGKTGGETAAAKSVLQETKVSMRATDRIEEKTQKHYETAEIVEILSLLRTSHLQTVYENYNDFCSPRNKFEALIEKINNFEKNQQAKNSPRFFSSEVESKKLSLNIAVETKIKPAKR